MQPTIHLQMTSEPMGGFCLIRHAPGCEPVACSTAWPTRALAELALACLTAARLCPDLLRCSTVDDPRDCITIHVLGQSVTTTASGVERWSSYCRPSVPSLPVLVKITGSPVLSDYWLNLSDSPCYSDDGLPVYTFLELLTLAPEVSV